MRHKIYYDNAASTKASDAAVKKMLDIYINKYANSSSVHNMGIDANIEIKEARKTFMNILNVDSANIIFTSGGTESNNLAIKGYVERNLNKNSRLFCLKTEHSSVLEVFKYLELKGYNVSFLDVDANGFLDINKFRKEVENGVDFVSVAHVNSETGTIQDLASIAQIIKTKNKKAVFHSDCVQSLGKLNVLPRTSQCDLISFSGHKIHAGKGVGALYHGKNILLEPLIIGGGQENNLRSGTENSAGIASMAVALEEMNTNMDHNFTQVCAIKENIIKGSKAICNKIQVNTLDNSSPYILSLYIPQILGETVLNMLNNLDVYISLSSACSAKNKNLSHVLKAMGQSDERVKSTIRLSFSKYNTLEESNEFLDRFEESIKMLKRL